MKNKIFAIGDIHGCYEELMLLIKKLPLDPKSDKVIFLGDYIDRGPDSQQVVAQMIKWKKEYPHWVFLSGNHEDIFRDWMTNNAEKYGLNNWFGNGGRTTYESYSGHYGREVDGKFEFPKQPIFPPEHLNFLFRELEFIHEEEDYVFVHGGLVPGESIEGLKEMINPMVVGHETIINAILWAREGFIDSKWDWGKFVVFGHTPAYEKRWGKFGYPIMMKNKCGIDCAVCPPSSKRLAAIELPEKRIHLLEAKTHKYSVMEYNIIK